MSISQWIKDIWKKNDSSNDDQPSRLVRYVDEKIREYAANPEKLELRSSGSTSFKRDLTLLKRLAEGPRSRFGTAGSIIPTRLELAKDEHGNLARDEDGKLITVTRPAIVEGPARLLASESTSETQPEQTSKSATLSATTQPPKNDGDSTTGYSGSDEFIPENPVKSSLDAAVLNLLAKNYPEATKVLETGGKKYSNKDVYNYNSYVYLRKSLLEETGGIADVSPHLTEFLYWAKITLNDAVVNFLSDEIKDYIWLGPGRGGHYVTMSWPGFHADETEILWEAFLRYAAGDIYRLYVGTTADPNSVIEAFYEWLKIVLSGAPIDPDAITPDYVYQEIWEVAGDGVWRVLEILVPGVRRLDCVNSEHYDFPLYTPDHINFGLQLVFRQEWENMGNQQGPIIKTIPLGPKQSEKVTIKFVDSRKQKKITTEEREIERETESTSTESSTSEIASEAANSMNYNVTTDARTTTSAEASGNWGIFSGSASASFEAGIQASVGGDSSSNSRDTKSRMSESVAKVASRSRQNSKIEVNVERDVSTEYTTVSEINNPNDEIAITYVYYELYRKYSVYTFLAEANSVIFIPEKVPRYTEVNRKFVKRYDWIISRVLLDESFRADLTNVASAYDDSSTDDEFNENIKNELDITNFQSLMKDGAKEGLKTTGSFAGEADIFGSVAKVYRDQLDTKQRKTDELKNRQRSEERLFGHLRDNILHYMRAIWTQEDPEQRQLRYAQVMVPVGWEFQLTENTETDQQILQNMTTAWDGEYVPVIGTERPLSEVINPAGPIGYAGNYAMYYLKSDADMISLNQALSAMRAKYMRYQVSSSLVSGQENLLRDSYVIEPHWQEAIYRLEFNSNGEIYVTNDIIHALGQVEGDEIGMINSDTIDDDGRGGYTFEGLYLRFETIPKNSEYLIHLYNTGQLGDPELGMLHLNIHLPPQSDEAEYFESVLDDMRLTIPSLELPEKKSWNELPDDEKEKVRSNYHRYLLIKDNTREILLKSSNVVMDLQVGDTPALEEFKKLHRAVDVAKVSEEHQREYIDNIRRERRITKDNDYSDADIDRIVKVESGTDENSALLSDIGGDDNG